MDLIIQGFDIETSALRQLAKFSGANQIKRINRIAFRLVDAVQQECIPSFCLERELDFSFVNKLENIDNFRLIGMDMDSTLIGIESIDELADVHGVRKQVAELTKKTMYGDISFSESLIKRTALLRGLDYCVMQKIYDEKLIFNPGAERMLLKLRDAGIKTILISGGFTFFTNKLKERLGLDYAFANTLEVANGKLTGRLVGDIIGEKGKGEILNKIRNQLGFKKKDLLAVGDGANDVPMFEEAEISIAYHAKPIAQENATHVINHVGLDGIINILSINGE
tara:strand:- start:28557 stop:29399 length:843 start_codon:yes stop_codon:yes gene_type:complete